MNNLLQFFAYEHLPPHLQAVSKPIRRLGARPSGIVAAQFRKHDCSAPIA
jgi:hypothetical protein